MILLLFMAAAQEEGPLPNEYCPVMQGERAIREYVVVYEGRPVYFCCNNCLLAFRHDPEAYVDRLPQFRQTDGGWAAWWRRIAVSQLMVDLARMRPALLVVLAGLAAFLVGRRVPALRRGPEVDAPPPGVGLRVTRAILRGPLLASVLLAIMLIQVAWFYVPLASARDSETPAQSTAEQLLRFEREIAHQALLQGDGPHLRDLDVTYYRGNNERDDRLGLGGAYRTCTFQVSLCTEGREPIRPGTQVGTGPILLRLEVRRSPYTAAEFFTDESMARVALMAAPDEANEAPAIVRVTTIEPEWRWEAYYPLGVPAGTPYQNMHGTVFLSHTSTSRPDLIWQSAHYAIPWRILLKESVVQPQSRLWMAAVLIAGDFDDDRFGDWFGLDPIPELTEPNVEDRSLLGLPAVGQPVEETP